MASKINAGRGWDLWLNAHANAFVLNAAHGWDGSPTALAKVFTLNAGCGSGRQMLSRRFLRSMRTMAGTGRQMLAQRFLRSMGSRAGRYCRVFPQKLLNSVRVAKCACGGSTPNVRHGWDRPMWSTAEKDSRMQIQQLFAQNGVSLRKRQPLQKRLHFKHNDLKGYWKRRKEHIDLYTVKKDARPRLPVYSGWGTWPTHVGLVRDIQSQASRLFRGRLTNTSRCPVSISLKSKLTCDRSCDLIHLSTIHQDPADPVSHIALDWKCQYNTRPGTLMAKS